MDEEKIFEENFVGEENGGSGIESIQEKTSFYLAKLFEYFQEEN